MPAAVANRQRRVPVDGRRLRGAAARALAALGRAGGDVEIDVVDDDAIRRLNTQHRGVRRRTDVLSFPLEVPGGSLVGQVVISADAARRQARRVGVALAAELDLLVTHGVLHLVGWDDRDPVEADLMHRREREILAGAPERLWTGLLDTRSPSAGRSVRKGPLPARKGPLDVRSRERSCVAHPREFRPRGTRYNNQPRRQP